MVYKLKLPFEDRGNKKRQVTYIAPLQPLTLAAFPPWGSSAGAGRARPAGRKDRGIGKKWMASKRLILFLIYRC
jgi:hypothetical protein